MIRQITICSVQKSYAARLVQKCFDTSILCIGETFYNNWGLEALLYKPCWFDHFVHCIWFLYFRGKRNLTNQQIYIFTASVCVKSESLHGNPTNIIPPSPYLIFKLFFKIQIIICWCLLMESVNTEHVPFDDCLIILLSVQISKTRYCTY